MISSWSASAMLNTGDVDFSSNQISNAVYCIVYLKYGEAIYKYLKMIDFY